MHITKMKFAPLDQPLDTFTRLVNEHFEASKESDPGARYEASVQFCAKRWPDEYRDHQRRVMQD